MRNHARCLLSSFVIVVTCGLFSAAPASAADSDCVAFTDTLHSSSPSPIGSFTGVAQVTIGGQATTAGFTATPFGELVFAADGSATAKFADIWVFPNGALLATNRAMAVPTGNPGEFRVVGRITFTGGIGIYQNAEGKADFQGILQAFPDGTVQGSTTVKGKLCGLSAAGG